MNPYLIVKSGMAKNKLCGSLNPYRLRLRGDTDWEPSGEGWLFPLRCNFCHKLGGTADYELSHEETHTWPR